MSPSEELELCIKYGAGMSAKLPGIEFTIKPRNLPDEIPPRPEKPPLFRDVKEVLTQQEWHSLRGEYDRQWAAFRRAVVAQAAEQLIVGRLRRIQAMVRKIEERDATTY